MWNGLNVVPPTIHFGEESVLATVDEREGQVSLTFSLPKKPFVETSHTSHQHAVMTARVLHNPHAALGTFHWPYIPALNRFYGRRIDALHNPMRVEPEGLGVIVRVHESHVTLQGIPPHELATRIFDLAGMTATPSPAGRVSHRVITHMGGLEDCRVFKICGVRTLLHEFGPTKPFSHRQALSYIGPGFDAYTELFIEPRIHRALRPQDVFLYLVKKHVFRVGVELECTNCLLRGWYALDDLGERVKCEYCDASFQSGPQLQDQRWAYRLSGLFGRTRDHEGAIPVVLTLLQMSRCPETLFSMTYTTCMELTWPSSGGELQAETDFVIMTQNFDHEPIVVIGECKTNGEMSEDQITRLLTIAEKLSGIGVKPFIVFSKAGSPFTTQELEVIDWHQTIDLNFILLAPRELEPYDPYEVAVASGELERRFPSRLEDMAANTQEFYLETDPREVFERWLAIHGQQDREPSAGTEENS